MLYILTTVRVDNDLLIMYCHIYLIAMLRTIYIVC